MIKSSVVTARSQIITDCHAVGMFSEIYVMDVTKKSGCVHVMLIIIILSS